MSASVLETLRCAHEDMETIEKAASRILLEKHHQPKMAVACDQSIKYLIDRSTDQAQVALDIYADKDGIRTDDINLLAGQRGNKAGDVWTNFYDKVKEVKDYHRRFSVNQGVPEVHNVEWFYQRAIESDNSEAMFSGEEDLGKHVDMHQYYLQFINIRRLASYRKAKFRAGAIARLRKKNPHLDEDDPAIDKALEKEYQEIDYITWLQEFDQFHEIPRYVKYRHEPYAKYLEDMLSYLKDLTTRAQPLVDMKKIETQFEKEFEERWAEQSIPGWSQPTHKDPLFCLPTDRLLHNEAVLASHKSGKFYKKKVAELQKLKFEEQKAKVAESEVEDLKLAKLESLIGKWRDLLGDVITETVSHLQKKQSRTIDEMDREDEFDEEEDDGIDIDPDELGADDPAEDRPIYNPLNLPVGWDGKPIPFWLYKLHGLGIEYKCEICGNYSYWGRRAFERHFQEWRHAFGMRCLKIPNTMHFKDIIKIEDAITLYEKLKRDAEDQTFRPEHDVECEDIQGNVMSQRAFEDLRRQGLV